MSTRESSTSWGEHNTWTRALKKYGFQGTHSWSMSSSTSPSRFPWVHDRRFGCSPIGSNHLGIVMSTQRKSRIWGKKRKQTIFSPETKTKWNVIFQPLIFRGYASNGGVRPFDQQPRCWTRYVGEPTKINLHVQPPLKFFTVKGIPLFGASNKSTILRPFWNFGYGFNLKIS